MPKSPSILAIAKIRGGQKKCRHWKWLLQGLMFIELLFLVSSCANVYLCALLHLVQQIYEVGFAVVYKK